MTCRTCLRFNLDDVRDAAGRVQSEWVAKCRWIPPPLPDSIKFVNLVPGYVSANDGKDCPCHVPRTIQTEDQP